MRHEARRLVCINETKRIYKYINGNMKVRRKLIQAEDPLVPTEDEKETLDLILLGLNNHNIYGMEVDHMFATDLQDKIELVR